MKKLLSLFVFPIFLSLTFIPRQLLAAEKFNIDAKQAIAIEVETGKILYAKDEEKQVPIASLTKLLTAYLVYEAVETGQLSMESAVEISDYPYQLTASGVSNVYLEARNYQVKDLLQAALITSANSATIALAEAVAGSEPAFVDKMTQKLKEWGITDAKLVNSTGLNNAFLGDNRYPGSAEKEENHLSAREVALIARRLVLDYPQVLDITSQYSYTFEGYTHFSSDQLLKGGTYARPGVDGLKTAYSDTAGASYVGTLQGKEMRILTVVLNVQDGETNPDNRFIVTNALMDQVINQFTVKTILEKGKPYPKTELPLFNGTRPHIKPVAPVAIKAIVEKGKENQITSHFQAPDNELEAPIKKGTELGTLSLADQNKIARGYVAEQPSYPLIASTTIEEASWPASWWNHFVRYVNEKL